MSTTYAIVVRGAPVTLSALRISHHYRLRNADATIQPPDVPDGYTHEKALENIEEYKETYDRYRQQVEIERLITEIGACRLAFVGREEHLAQAKAELPKLRAVCRQLSLSLPDDIDDPLECGRRIVEIYNDGEGKVIDLSEFELWAELAAGGVDPAKIEEAIKSFRDLSKRSSDPGGNANPATDGEAQAPDQTGDHGKPASRPRKGRKGVGSAKP